jgi:hypothetical protein
VIVLLSGKYHMGSLVAIFFALGIGILIGGTLGQQWMFQTEQHTLSVLMDKYEGQMKENQKLQKHIGSLQLMQRTLVPIFEHKRILWVKPPSVNNEMLAEMMKSAGAEWVETEADIWINSVTGSANMDKKRLPDMIVISDPQAAILFHEDMQTKELLPEEEYPQVIDVSAEPLTLNEPQQVIDFIIRLRGKLKEELDGHAIKDEPASAS